MSEPPDICLVRGRRFPVIDDDGGVWSWIHVDDAAAVAVATVEGGDRGIYDVVDDDPAPVSARLQPSWTSWSHGFREGPGDGRTRNRFVNIPSQTTFETCWNDLPRRRHVQRALTPGG
ncbi:MAG TPA: hypothetical protein VFM27_05020 [Acidimicrobiales bacterium]|nr:hypothetical protein [Acidimicrobiales bacterium]